MTTRRCRSRSEYGRCGRRGKHCGPHAVPIGDGVIFGYERGGRSLGYGRLDGSEPWTFLDGECDEAFAAAQSILAFRSTGDLGTESTRR